MTPLEQIDFVFFHIKSKIQVGASWGYHNVWNYVKMTEEANINETMFKEIIQKLQDDGYLTEKYIEGAQPCYNVTFKGLIFEGYSKEHESLNEEKTWLKNLQVQTLKTSKKLNLVTWIIAVGTFFAALYYILEILNDFFSFYPK